MNASFRRKTRRNDRIARWLITLGGMAIIFSVIFILVLIVNVTLPLFQQASATPVASNEPPAPSDGHSLLLTGIDDYLENAYTLDTSGTFRFVNIQSGETGSPLEVQPPRPGAQVVEVDKSGPLRYGLRWDDGSATLVDIVFTPFYDENDDNRRSIRYRLRTLSHFEAMGETGIERSLIRMKDEARTRVDLLGDGRLRIIQYLTEEDFFGDVQVKTFDEIVDRDLPGKISALALDQTGRHLYAGTDKGFLLAWDLSEPGDAQLTDKVRTNSDGAPVSALGLVFGDVSLAVGDSRGRLSTWSPARDPAMDAKRSLKKLHQLAPHPSAVLEIVPSLRDKSILSFSRDGGLHLDHMTSERHLLELQPSDAIATFALSKRSDALVTLSGDGRLTAWRIENPHPEVSGKTLFGKVWYEGYDEPVWAWQSSSASDDFEPKLSLTPLVFGTLKGTFYAMLFALPLALFGAIYTSQFCRPKARAIIKPMVEIMAAIPTVIIGFLAALWLAPIIETSLGAFFLSVVFMPAALMIAIIIWQFARNNESLRSVERGHEFLAAAPILLLAVATAFTLGPGFEKLFFGGDLKQWLFETWGTRYDPRNCIVIAFGMGFAVIPIIFTIAEDSLSNVPPGLKAASLACGASRWQTVWRVILPSASPGIFAGAMIGFGRAVGETMIVLMATGNTAIIDMSIFNGMRPLSSNIAVEIPEAPFGTTLYRVLFLSAVILFVMTFVVNTGAEIVRQRLRAKYGRF